MGKQKNNSNRERVEQQNNALKQHAQQLNQLQGEIESNDALSVKHGKITLELALRAGAILLEAKKLVPYGEWESWLADNVKGIALRTAQNYMKLAQEVAIEKERVDCKRKFGKSDTQYVSFLADCEGLREAYLVAGVIKKPKMVDAAVMPVENNMTPERMKAENKSLYCQKVSDARIRMAKYFHAVITKKAKGVNWNLSQWSIRDNKLVSSDENMTNVNGLVRSLVADVNLRRHSELTREDEIGHKTGVVITELLKALVVANSPTESEADDDASQFSMELNPEPAEAVEKMAA